jgi:hypothetical protein
VERGCWCLLEVITDAWMIEDRCYSVAGVDDLTESANRLFQIRKSSLRKFLPGRVANTNTGIKFVGTYCVHFFIHALCISSTLLYNACTVYSLTYCEYEVQFPGSSIVLYAVRRTPCAPWPVIITGIRGLGLVRGTRVEVFNFNR